MANIVSQFIAFFLFFHLSFWQIQYWAPCAMLLMLSHLKFQWQQYTTARNPCFASFANIRNSFSNTFVGMHHCRVYFFPTHHIYTTLTFEITLYHRMQVVGCEINSSFSFCLALRKRLTRERPRRVKIRHGKSINFKFSLRIKCIYLKAVRTFFYLFISQFFCVCRLLGPFATPLD